ncbi:MAG: NosD domain-containing protein [Candidatus Bathyarchaeia archaeon]
MRRFRKIPLAILFTLVLAGLFHNAAGAMQTVFINADGSVYPSSVPIQREGDTYIFTGDLYACLIVNRSGITIDGAGYTLRGSLSGGSAGVWVGQGPTNETTAPYTIGIDTAHGKVTGLTIKNLNIRDFSIGMYIWTTNNTVIGNAVLDNIVGVLLSGSNNSVICNYIAGNEMGMFFGTNEPGTVPLNLTVSHNSFINNTNHLGGCVCKEYNLSETVHTWDNGREGNYWCDYNGTDVDGDGIGDTPYVIDVLNQDRFPLMRSYASPPTANKELPAVVLVAIVVAVCSIVVVMVLVGRKRKT